MLERFIAQAGDMIVMAVAAFLFGILRLLLLPDRHPVRVYFVSLLSSVAVGVLAGLFCKEIGWGDIASMGAVSLASLLAHDLLMGIMNNRQFLGQILKRAVENLTDKVTK